MTVKRKFKQSPMDQGEDERIAYRLDTEPWGGSPGNVVVVIKLGGTDESATHLSGSSSIESSRYILTPLVIALEKGKKYKLEIQWTYMSNTFEAYGLVTCSEE